MQYHIQTAPIWDAFKENDGCPMCKLYAKVQDRLVKQYTDEAVMEPEYRVKVNERGFCAKHLDMLYHGQNKLGVALQVNTRTEAVINSIDMASNAKSAKKLAEKLLKTVDSCVICDEADAIMERYYYTVAQMFCYEPEFPTLLKQSKGFCMPHFIQLLKYADYASKASAVYTTNLCKVQKDGMRADNSALDRFTKRFDYNSSDKYSSTTDDALSTSINRLKGDLIKD